MTQRAKAHHDVLAKLLKGTKRRDIIVVSFQQEAVDRFHELAPKIDLAPGIGGAAGWIFGGSSHYTGSYTDATGRRRNMAGWDYVHIAIDDATRLALRRSAPR